MSNTNEAYRTSTQLTDKIAVDLDCFNKGRSGTNGVYLISFATRYRPYYALWRLFKDKDIPLFIRSLAITADEAIERAKKMLMNCNITLQIADDSLIEPCYSITEDIIPFGKYRGKHIAEIYYIDPPYVLWLANRFEAKGHRYDNLIGYAKEFSQVHVELTVRKSEISSLSRYVGEVHGKLNDLYLSVLNVRLQVDTYKPDFYVDQNVLAADKDGNRFIFYVKAKGRSMSPDLLNCYTRVIEKHEVIHIVSAKVMAHFTRNGVEYTKLGYIKLK